MKAWRKYRGGKKLPDAYELALLKFADRTLLFMKNRDLKFRWKCNAALRKALQLRKGKKPDGRHSPQDCAVGDQERAVQEA